MTIKGMQLIDLANKLRPLFTLQGLIKIFVSYLGRFEHNALSG